MKKLNKKTIILLSIIAIVAVFVTSAITLAMSPRKDLKPSDYNIGTTYELAVVDKKPMITLFYTNWCTYCMRFMPKYKMIADIYKDKYNFVMIDVENPKYKKLVKDYSISGFPTIYIIDPSIDNRISINNGIYDDLSKLRGEFDRYLRIKAMIKP